MAWTTPSTATAGATLTAALWNQQVRDNMVDVGQPGIGVAILTSSQSMSHQASETYTNYVQFNSLTVAKNVTITAPGVLRFDQAGIWEVSASVRWPATASATGTSFRAIKITAGASFTLSRDMRPNVQNVDTICHAPPVPITATVGTVMGLQTWQNSGGSLSIQQDVFVFARLLYR